MAKMASRARLGLVAAMESTDLAIRASLALQELLLRLSALQETRTHRRYWSSINHPRTHRLYGSSFHGNGAFWTHRPYGSSFHGNGAFWTHRPDGRSFHGNGPHWTARPDGRSFHSGGAHWAARQRRHERIWIYGSYRPGGSSWKPGLRLATSRERLGAPRDAYEHDERQPFAA